MVDPEKKIMVDLGKKSIVDPEYFHVQPRKTALSIRKKFIVDQYKTGWLIAAEKNPWPIQRKWHCRSVQIQLGTMQSPTLPYLQLSFHFTWTSKRVYMISPHPHCPHYISYTSSLRIWGSCGIVAVLFDTIINPRTPGGGGGCHPLAFFPCNIFDDSNGKNRLSVSVTSDRRHILTFVTSSWRCHGTYVMTSNVRDGGQNTMFLRVFVTRDIF